MLKSIHTTVNDKEERKAAIGQSKKSIQPSSASPRPTRYCSTKSSLLRVLCSTWWSFKSTSSSADDNVLSFHRWDGKTEIVRERLLKCLERNTANEWTTTKSKNRLGHSQKQHCHQQRTCPSTYAKTAANMWQNNGFGNNGPFQNNFNQDDYPPSPFGGVSGPPGQQYFPIPHHPSMYEDPNGGEGYMSDDFRPEVGLFNEGSFMQNQHQFVNSNVQVSLAQYNLANFPMLNTTTDNRMLTLSHPHSSRRRRLSTTYLRQLHPPLPDLITSMRELPS